MHLIHEEKVGTGNTDVGGEKTPIGLDRVGVVAHVTTEVQAGEVTRGHTHRRGGLGEAPVHERTRGVRPGVTTLAGWTLRLRTPREHGPLT
ncbi:hypothetical protein GCM10025883_20850 [Mobilicoccus caccae]|uniref:Uncharacterized protein n=1 Tax=Mobilicoccus caccae TaxID=1859295 RepID=A0ABQ6IQ52_9MICO|nr:hypothetical protein GCM10025883_20850 [Mobilicoccus caccae]